jgi:hypothetical protein
MTTTVTEATKKFILSNSYDVFTSVGIIAILLLVVLMIEQELLRAYGGPRARTGVQIANGFIIPLAFAFAVIVILRLAHILYPGRF